MGSSFCRFLPPAPFSHREVFLFHALVEEFPQSTELIASFRSFYGDGPPSSQRRPFSPPVQIVDPGTSPFRSSLLYSRRKTGFFFAMNVRKGPPFLFFYYDGGSFSPP